MHTKQISEQINIILANTYALMTKTQSYHWHVVGVNFKGLHELFEMMYKDYFEAIDALAERNRALNQYAVSNFDEFKRLSTISNANNNLTAIEMLKDLLGDQDKMINHLRQALVNIAKIQDRASEDLLIERLVVHEKQRWFLVAHLS